MRTVRTKVYMFEELNAAAQATAIDRHREENDIDLDFLNEGFIEQAHEIGFSGKIQLQYRLSYSQGDGLSFSCEYLSNELLNKAFKSVLGEGKDKTIQAIQNECSFVLKGNTGFYCYALKNQLSYEFENYHRNYQNINEVVYKVQDFLQTVYFDLCKKFENDGYQEIENQQSDNYLKEELIQNDYEFLQNGTYFNL